MSGGERDAGPTGPLPAAFKGYELYAWDESTGLEFTLITGTNREKSVAEITSRGRAQTGSEFVVVSGSGLQALERAIDRAARGGRGWSRGTAGRDDAGGAMDDGDRARLDAAMPDPWTAGACSYPRTR